MIYICDRDLCLLSERSYIEIICKDMKGKEENDG